jgi:hypothetical protein
MASLATEVKKHGLEFLNEAIPEFELQREEVEPGLEKKLTNAKDINIQHLFEELMCPISHLKGNPKKFLEVQKKMRIAEQKRELGLELQEADVLSTAFDLLTQAKLFTTMEATYILTSATHEQLFGTFQSDYKNYPHQIPSDAPVLLNVNEDQNYPEAQLSDRAVMTRAWKFGRIVGLTRETMIQDKTGQVVKQCEDLAKSAKYREDELACLAWQDTSNASLITEEPADAGSYFVTTSGTRVPLYRTAAGTTAPAYESVVNKTSANPLNTWQSLVLPIRLLRQMQNNAGQYIDVINGQALTVVAPFGLEGIARQLLAPGAMNQIVNNPNTSGTEFNITRVPDFINSLGVSSIKLIIWDKLPTAGTASQSTWYLAGDSKQAARKHQRWGVEFDRATAAQLGGEDFKKDRLMAFRAGFNAGTRFVDDKYVIQCPGA